MALQTKTFNSSTTSNQFYLQLILTENSTNQTNNTSDISYILKLYSGGWDFSQYNIGHSISLAGKTVSSVARANASKYSISTNSNITLASGSTTIDHNSDGSKNISIAFSIDMAKDSWTPGVISVSGKSMVLTSIPRASTVSCSTAYIGSSATITINRASSSFTHTLTYTFGDLTGTVATKTTSTSVSFALPTLFYEQIPSAKSGTGTITCDTYNDSTKIGTKTCKFTATCNESSCKPTIFGTAVDTNTTTKALTGDSAKFIKYYSNANVSSSVSAQNCATLKSQSVTCGSKSISSSSGTINGVDSGTFTFSATDSRGYTTTQTLNKTLIDYIKLTCTIASQAATTSGVAKINVSGNYWNGNFGAVTNTLTIQYRYKTNGGAYNEWTNSSATVSKSNNTYSTTINVSGLNYLNTYTFQARAIDKLATIESNAQATKTKPIFDWGSDDFNINGTLNINGTNIFNLVYPVGAIYMSVNNTNPNTLFGGTWVALQNRFLIGAGDNYNGGSTGGEATHTLTVNEMPSHNHAQYVAVSSGGNLAANCDYNSYSSNSARKAAQNITTGDKGGNVAHNNMPPYLAVYIWKRTA